MNIREKQAERAVEVNHEAGEVAYAWKWFNLGNPDPRSKTMVATLVAFTIFWPHASAQTSPPPFTPLYDFTGGSDGGYPGNLIAAGNGSLYGTTQEGGTSLGGTVFELTPPTVPGGAWALTVLYAFAYNGGSDPVGLVAGENGALYGATLSTGPDCVNCGIVFELTPPASPGGGWTETTLYRFTGGTDGGIPQAGPVIGKNGALYGTTFVGGTGTCNYVYSGCGTVFELTPPASPGGAWTETVLFNFQGGSDGGAPVMLTIDKNGVLYGTTLYGGNPGCINQWGCGAIFGLTPPSSPGGAWTETVLHSLPTNVNHYNEALLAIGGNGTIYGGTTGGGADHKGSVFELTPPAVPGGAWIERILYSFTGGSDGKGPYSLVAGKNGTLYGVTDITVFKLAPPSAAGGPWNLTSLHHFHDRAEGANPSGVIPPNQGVLYGATNFGGSGRCFHSNHDYGCGTIFQLGP